MTTKKKDYSIIFGIGIIVSVVIIMSSLVVVPKILSRTDDAIDEEYIKAATAQASFQWWKEEYTTKAPEELPEETQARLKVLTLDIEGMVCTGCAKAIMDSLESEEGVITAKTNFQEATGVLVYDPEVTSPEKIIASDIFAGFYSGKVKSEKDWGTS